MGKTNPQQMKTYMQFIERFYYNEGLQIEYKKALQLYKVILTSAKGPQFELADQIQENNGLRQQFAMNKEVKWKSMTNQQENTLIELFRKYRSIQKVSDQMCRKYQYHQRWSNMAIKKILQIIYKSSIMKLANTANIYLKNPVNLLFGYGDDDILALQNSKNSIETKIVLLDFYKLKKITELKLRQFVKKVNQFYKQLYKNQGVIHLNQPQRVISIPILIIDDKPIEVIDLVEQERRHPKRQSCHSQISTQSKKRRRVNTGWKEVILLDESIQVQQPQRQEQHIQEKEIQLFPRRINRKDKQVNENTDIQEEQPTQRRRQQEIFKPKKPTQKKDQTKEKEPIKEKKDQKKIDLPQPIIKEEQPMPQTQQKTQKIAVLKQSFEKNKIKKIKKKSHANSSFSSFDSIESEPARLIVDKSEISRSKKMYSKLKKRFTKKNIEQENDKITLQN